LVKSAIRGAPHRPPVPSRQNWCQRIITVHAHSLQRFLCCSMVACILDLSFSRLFVQSTFRSVDLSFSRPSCNRLQQGSPVSIDPVRSQTNKYSEVSLLPGFKNARQCPVLSALLGVAINGSSVTLSLNVRVNRAGPVTLCLGLGCVLHSKSRVSC
jgi:hypothetical protein